MKIVGIILVVVGVVALVYQGFSYTTERQVADLGIAEVRAQETETIPIPPYVGVILVAAGVGAILLARKRE
jgi:hypothetical protein